MEGDFLRPDKLAGLDSPQRGIQPVVLHQLIVGSAFGDLTGLEDPNTIGVANRRQSMGNNDRGSAFGDMGERALDRGFGFVIDG